MSSTTERGPGAASEASLAELIKQLSEQSSHLARQEVELARAELAVKGKRAGIGAGMFGGAGAFGFYGLGALTAAAILALATAVTAWLAALIIAAVFAAIAGVLALQGKTQGAAGDPAGARGGDRERGGRAMGQDPGTAGTPVTEAKDPEQIREEIEETRRELGDTVEALAAKADVKARVREKVESTKESATHKKDQLLGKARETSPDSVAAGASQATQKARENPLPVAAVGAFVSGFVVGRLTKRS
jgi:ElaB/YqjD/DUF883 family membrane-anchored ribosome-binding protein